jgi:hypothetical protein
MHDNSRDLVGLFFGRLHYLSRPGRREIFGIHRLDRRYLLPDPGFARSTCFCNVASGDFDAYPGFSAPMGPAQTDRALDDSNLAVRVDHRGVCVFDALQMVSSGNVMRAILPQVWSSAFRRQLWRAFSRRVNAELRTTRNCLRHAKSCARQLFDV